MLFRIRSKILWMNSLKKQIEEFREKTEKFSKGEINVAEYKSFSGKFGSYAQRGS